MTRTTLLTRPAARRLLSLGAAVGLGLTLLPATPAQAATSQRVGGSFFGMHDGDPNSWPEAPVGSIRLWDSGVTWREIEKANGVFDFSLLDSQVDNARAHGARVLLVLGQTPRFHSTRPGKSGSYGLGAASMPTESSWRNYVYKVVTRYRGRGVDYQVWNEANVSGYWNGSPAQMAKLTQWTSKIVNNNDRSAKVVSPALATRLTGQRKWLRTYFAQRTGGKRVAAYVDVVSLNLYPLPKQAPEASMTLLSASRTMLAQAGVSKPIWNTEINYGLGSGAAPRISDGRQAANVMRTYLLNAANRVKRVFWYRYDLSRLAGGGSLANTLLTPMDHSSRLTAAGRAYLLAREWMHGRLLGTAKHPPCDTDRHGTYTCVVEDSSGKRWIYWNPLHRAEVRLPRGVHHRQGVLGATSSVTPRSTIDVGYKPVMVHR